MNRLRFLFNVRRRRSQLLDGVFAFCLTLGGFVLASNAHGQGMIRSSEEIDALAEQYLFDFANYNLELGDKYACLARGEVWHLDATDEESLADTVVLRATDKSKSLDYAAWAAVNDYSLYNGRVWEQRFLFNQFAVTRMGTGGRNDMLTHAVPGVKGYVERVKLYAPVVDPIQFMISHYGAEIFDTVDETYTKTFFIGNGRFIGGTTDKQGCIVGIWAVSGKVVESREYAVVDITFGKEPPNLPVRVVWRRKSIDDDEASVKSRESLPISQVNNIEWSRHPSGSHVPAKLHRGTFGAQGRTIRELVLEFQWKLGTEFEIAPPPKDQLVQYANLGLDWRAPMSELFGDDFNTSYKEWKELQVSFDKPVK